MRVLPALGIMAAAVVLAAGCAKSGLGSAWMSIKEPTPPTRPSLSADPLGSVGKADRLPDTPVLTPRLRASSGTSESASVSDEVVRRIAESQEDWEDYRAGLPAQTRTPDLEESDAQESVDVSAKETPESEPLISPAVRRKYAAEYANARMRIAILEARLKNAGEAERSILEAKLEEAKSELRTIDRIGREESHPPKTEFSSGTLDIQPAVRR